MTEYIHADRVRQLVDAMPPLTPEQRAVIANIFQTSITSPNPMEEIKTHAA
ncbi:hypothetical protein [Nonomuraea candida]|uniref:hypothetical protein n=1 Tax=Nonomuraea candida TaxID=359159 RepID=UPI000A70D83F|nr:hypothetical protein [Nonomuraea candida]